MARFGLVLGLIASCFGVEAQAQHIKLPVCIVSNLELCGGGNIGNQAVVYDSASASACSTGGGSNYVVCTKTPSGWIASGGGGGTPDDDSVDADKMADDDFGDWSCSSGDCTLDSGVVDDTAAAAALTRDTEWDTASEINTATTDADFPTRPASNADDDDVALWDGSGNLKDGGPLLVAADVQDQAFDEATTADWTAWTSDPTTISGALDSIGTAIRALALSVSHGYDQAVIGFGDSAYRISFGGASGYSITSYSDPSLAIQSAANTWGDFDVSSGEFSILIAGTFNFDNADGYDGNGALPIKHFVMFSAAASTDGSSWNGYEQADGSAGTTANGWPNPLAGKAYVDATGSATTTTTTSVLTDSAASFGATNAQLGRSVEIVTSSGGTCDGDRSYITASTGTTLTVSPNLSGSCTVQAYRVYAVPHATMGGKELTVHWAPGTRIVVDTTSQAKRWVVLMYGNGWYGGYYATSGAELAGGVSSVHEIGAPFILIDGNVESTNYVDGTIPNASSAGIVDGNNAVIAVAQIQRTKSNVSGRWRIAGNTPVAGSGNELDDIGIFSANTWGTNRIGGATINNMGLGVALYSNNVATWGDYYLSANETNLAVGSGANGAGMTPYASCLSGLCAARDGYAAGPALVKLISEGSAYGLFDMYEGGPELELISPHFEAGTVSGHQVLLGAGRCSGNAATFGRACAETADCNVSGSGGTCDAAGGATMTSSIRVRGGQFPGVTDDRWAGLMLGKITDANGWIRIASDIGYSYVDATNAACTAAATPFFFCEGSGTAEATYLMYRTPESQSGMTTNVSFDGSSTTTAGIVPTPYTYLSSDRAIRTVFGTDGSADLTTTDCMRLGTGAGVSCDGTNESIGTARVPYAVGGSASHPNIYIKELCCALGTVQDTSGDVQAWRVYVGDTTSNVAAGAAVSFTQGTDALGSVKCANVATNTARINCGSGTCASKATGGIMVRMQTDTAGGGSAEQALDACTVTWWPSIGND